MINSTTLEPECNGNMHDENPVHLEKCDESHKIKEETKTFDGLEVTICQGLGKG